MPYTKNYEKQTWEDLPEQTTPISAERLTHMEDGIDINDTRITAMSIDVDITKTDVESMETALASKMDSGSPTGTGSLSLNRASYTTIGDNSSATGTLCEAAGNSAHAEGYATKANGGNSHAEGYYTKAIGEYTHAEGYMSEANGSYSHAEGNMTKANGVFCHTEGYGTEAHASGMGQHIQGKYNVIDEQGLYAHIVGGGNSSSSRINIHTLDWNGNAAFAGNVTDGNGDSIASLKALIAAISGGGINITIVAELPTESISTTTIYFVPAQTGETGDFYDEYMYINSSWELIGNTEVDLSDYYTKPEADARYLQGYTETDPTVPAWAKQETKPDYTAEEVGALPDDTPIPVNTSDLTNDSSFVSDSSYVHTDNNFNAAYKGNVDSNTSARHIHSNKTVLDATTASYLAAEKTKLSGIDQGANKTIVDTTFNTVSTNPATSTAIAAWVQAQIANGSLRKEIVTALPTTNISTDVIYMILKQSAGTDDIYNEYLNMDGTTSGWELIGSSSVDLTNVYTKTESNNLFAFKADMGSKADLTTTEKGTVVGAINEVNNSLTAPTAGMFIYDYQDGSHGFNTSPTRGADTFIPFSKGGLIPYLTWNEKTWDAGESSISATSEAATQHVECLRGAYLDLNTVSSWSSTNATMPQSITVTFKTAKTVSKIELIASSNFGLYTPSDMVFYGSNDGTTWTTLIPSMKMPALPGLQKEFEVSQNKGSYKYYKLTITAVNGGTVAILNGMQFY